MLVFLHTSVHLSGFLISISSIMHTQVIADGSA